MRSTRTFTLLVILAAATAAFAASPPERIHYQGVLRDASDNPIDGTRDMVFSFYDTDGGGASSWRRRSRASEASVALTSHTG